MTWRTHALVGISTVWLLTSIPDAITPSNFAIVAAAAALGALLPDLDAAQSKIKNLKVGSFKPLVGVSEMLNRSLGHRKLFHSFLGLTVILAMSLILLIWLPWQAAIALLLGFFSHMLVDALTPAGVPFLYPNLKKYHLLPEKLRIRTSSEWEWLIFVLALALSALLLISQLAVAIS